MIDYNLGAYLVDSIPYINNMLGAVFFAAAPVIITIVLPDFIQKLFINSLPINMESKSMIQDISDIVDVIKNIFNKR